MFLKALIAPDVPPNDGCYRPLHVTIPPRTVLSPDPDRIFYVKRALELGTSHDEIHRMTGIDRWFLRAIAPYLPTYHYAQLSWGAIGAASA